MTSLITILIVVIIIVVITIGLGNTLCNIVVIFRWWKRSSLE